ncbi:MAG: hypothetical protein MJB12_12995 [Firmicutes bacterium]|nr:hypothetical protein [Bacillota bacterium]
MNERIIIHVLRMKLGLMEAVIDKLPEGPRKRIKDIQSTLFKAVHEVTGVYGCKEDGDQSKNSVKSIVVD